MLKEYSISEILSTDGFTPTYAGTFEQTEDPDIEWPHRHSFYSLIWFTEGNGFYVVDFQEYEIKPGRVFLINPKQVHNWDYSENCKGYLLMADTVIGLELNLACFYPMVDVPPLYFTALKSCFSHLIHEYSLKDELSAGHIRISIQYLFALVRRIASQTQVSTIPHHAVIEKLRALVMENNLGILSVEQYAEKLHLLTESLNQICKTTTGNSTKQYVLDLKITEAKRLLLFSRFNVSEIAYKLGFEDSSYFARIFKKKTNQSPTEFLEKYRRQT